MKKSKLLISIASLAAAGATLAPLAALSSCSCGGHEEEEKKTVDLVLINDKPELNKYTLKGNVEFKFNAEKIPTLWPEKGTRTAEIQLVNASTTDAEVSLISEEVEIGEEGLVTVPIKLSKVPTGFTGGTLQLTIKISLTYYDKTAGKTTKSFDVYPTCYVFTEEDKEKIVTESALNIVTSSEGIQTVNGIKSGTDLSKKTSITIPADCNVASLKVLGSNEDLPESIKTIFFTAPTKSTDADGLACWYTVQNGALNGTKIDTIVFDDFTNKNMMGFEDYALDDDYDESTGTGSHTNIKNIDISTWSFATVKNIDKYAGGYLGQPFYDMTDANFTWPSCKNEVSFKSAVYRIFNVGGLNDTLLEKIGLKPTITTEEHFTFASFGNNNKIIIGTDGQQAWTDSTVYIPAGTTDILPFAFQEYIGGKYQSSFPACVQVIDFSRITSMNSIGYSAFQDSSVTMIKNFPQVTGGCAMCLYYQGEGIKLNPVNSHIKYITVANGVTSIPYAAFAMIEHLTTVNLPDSVTTIDEGAFYYSGYAMYGTYSPETPLIPFTIHFPESLTSIGSYAFYGANLGYIKFPKNLKIIGDYAFAGRDKSEGHQDYYGDATWCLDFSEIENINEIPSGWKSSNIFKYHWNTASPKSIIRKDNTTSIDNLKNWLLTNGQLGGPGQETYYSQYLVYGNLQTLTDDDLTWTLDGDHYRLDGIKDSVQKNGVFYNLNVPATYNGKPVTTIGAFAFRGGEGYHKLYSLNLDNATNLTTITYNAFCQQTTLVGEVNFPSSITNVGSGAFEYTNVEVFRLNAATTGCTYDSGCFRYNDTLARVELADNDDVGDIVLNNICFLRCQALQYLELSPKISTIGASAFEQACNLWYIDLHNFKNSDEIPTNWNKHAFDNAFAYIRGRHADETQPVVLECSNTPMYGLLGLNKNCSTFKDTFMTFLTNSEAYYHEMWDGTTPEAAGSLVEVKDSFLPCYE